MSTRSLAVSFLSLLILTALAVPAGAVEIQDFGKCMDIRQGVIEPGTPVQLYTCNGTISQDWAVVEVPANDESGEAVEVHVKVNPALCLDVRGGVNANGTPIQIWPCNGTLSQRFYARPAPNGINGVMLLTTIPSDLRCVDVTGGNPADGTPIQLWDCNNTQSQFWTF